MGLSRCPKCDAIIYDDDDECKYCGYVLKPKVVTVTDKDSFSVDGDNVLTTSRNPSESTKFNVAENRVSIAEKKDVPLTTSNNRVKTLRHRYLLILIVSLFFIGIGILFLILGINEMKTEGKSEAMMPVAVAALIIFIPVFVYSLVRFIQSFAAPVELVKFDEETKDKQAEIVGEVAAEVITGIIDGLL